MARRHVGLVALFGLLLGALIAGAGQQAQAQHPETWYQQRWCALHGGEVEVVLADRTRVDCLTETHAVELDFAPKWAESLGQALHYAGMTGKRAGIVLIVERDADLAHVARLTAVLRARRLDVTLWVIRQRGTGIEFLAA